MQIRAITTYLHRSLPPSPPQLTTVDNRLIVNDITPFKSSEPTRTNNNSNNGKLLLTAQQKLDNLQQQIEDGTIYPSAMEKKKWVNQIVKQNKQKETNKSKETTHNNNKEIKFNFYSNNRNQQKYNEWAQTKKNDR